MYRIADGWQTGKPLEDYKNGKLELSNRNFFDELIAEAKTDNIPKDEVLKLFYLIKEDLVLIIENSDEAKKKLVFSNKDKNLFNYLIQNESQILNKINKNLE